MTKREMAESNFKCGYNCAQAVALAFSEELGLDKETVLKLASAFGGGLGRQRLVCGAISGMALVLGGLTGYDNPTDMEGKIQLYKTTQELCEQFKKQNGSIICERLLEDTNKITHVPEKRTKEYYKKRPCMSLCGDVAEILQNYLEKNK